MSNFIKMMGALTITVIIPLAVLLGIWADILPQIIQVWIAQFGVAASMIYIIGGTLFLAYGDIKTKRYASK